MSTTLDLQAAFGSALLKLALVAVPVIWACAKLGDLARSAIATGTL